MPERVMTFEMLRVCVMCMCIERCQSVGRFADSLALAKTQNTRYIEQPSAGCHLTSFSGRKNDSQHLLRLHYHFNAGTASTPHSHTYKHTRSRGNVNERSVVDKNGWLLIIKSYIKRIDFAIKFSLNNHFNGEKRGNLYILLMKGNMAQVHHFVILLVNAFRIPFFFLMQTAKVLIYRLINLKQHKTGALQKYQLEVSC